MTDHDGRCSTLLSAGSKLDVGIFKITFFTSECVVLPSAYLSAPLTRLSQVLYQARNPQLLSLCRSTLLPLSLR